MEHEIPFETFQQEKRVHLLRISPFSGNFLVDEPTKCFPFTAEPKFPEILTTVFSRISAQPRISAHLE